MLMAMQNTVSVFFGNTSLGVPSNFLVGHIARMNYLDRMKALRVKKGLTQAELGEKLGVQQATIQRWERGDREPSFEQLFRLADVLDTDVPSLIDSSLSAAIGPRLHVKGEVAAGVWRDAVEWPADEWQAFTGRSDINAKMDYRFGLRVIGDSMDQVYPHGTIIECVSVFDHAEIAPGRRVVVIRKQIGDGYEATVKELVEQGGELWAVPRSNNPAHVPFKLSEPGDDIESVRIAAIVVASVRPE